VSSHWHIGMKVECIKTGEWTNRLACEVVPVFGRIYTIRSVDENEHGVWLRFSEVINSALSYRNGVREARFSSIRFRPVQTKKTSIEVFTALLTPTEDDKAEIELLDYELAQ